MPAESVSELYRALMLTYERCIKAKPAFKKSRFHMEYAQEIYRLAFDIVHRRYAPSISNIFVVFYPKPREIIAAHLRDRIVHHYIYEYMSPFWERRFSPRSYACRKGKGPLAAVQDLSGFVRGFRAHSSQPLYYLKVDIAAFFPSLDLDILRSILMKKLTHSTYRYLVDVTLKHRPVDPGQFVLKCPREYWKRIPRHKSMFYAPRNKGLPIGNLTSQFFANVYLNELDQFITHKLKGHYVYWQRYVDDVLFLSDNQDSLQQLPAIVDEFLRTKLALRLNPAKTIIQPLDRGVDHLGFWIKPDHRLVRQKNVKVCFTKLRSGAASPEGMQATLNSYMGLFRCAASKRLRSKIGRELAEEEFFDGRLEVDVCAERVVVLKDHKKAAAEERAFVDEFKRHVEPARTACYLQKWKSVGSVLRDAADFLA